MKPKKKLITWYDVVGITAVANAMLLPVLLGALICRLLGVA